LAKSSNKNLERIIKKKLEDNKRSWDSKLKFSLWADRVTTEKSIGNSPFKPVYGTEVVFPIQLTLPVAKFLQEELDEGDDMARRMSDLVEVQKIREQLIEKLAVHQNKIKEVFEKRQRWTVFRLVTRSSSGTCSRKRRVIMANSTPCGHDLLSLLRLTQTTPSSFTIWRGEMFLMA